MSEQKNELVLDNIHDIKAAMRKKAMEKYQNALSKTKKYKEILDNQAKAKAYQELLAKTGAIGLSKDEQDMQKASKELEEEMRKIDQYNPQQEKEQELAKKLLGNVANQINLDKVAEASKIEDPNAVMEKHLKALKTETSQKKLLPDEEG